MKRAIIFAILFFLFCGINYAFSYSEEIQIDFFYSTNCHFCLKEKSFLDNLEKKYPELKIKKWEIAKDNNFELLTQFYQNYQVPAETQGLVPVTFIKDRYFVGYDSDETTGQTIEDYILESKTPSQTDEINLPILGKIDAKKYSLPVLAILLGFLDGFNVCSLGALVLILSLILAFRSRFKIIFLGGMFLFFTAVIYGLLIFFWFKVFSFMGIYIRKMEILVGLLSLAGGFYFLRNFLKFRKKTPTCEIESGWGKNIIAKLSRETKKLFQTKKILYIILGILIFDAAITIIEFPCSAAVPLVFAGILTKANLASIPYFLHLALYLFFYLLDEVLVLLAAIWTMKIWALSSRFVVWSSLLGAMILFSLGIYYLF